MVNLGAGALVRNIGEVLGVFGALDVNTDLRNPAGHSHSVNVNGLATLEDYLLHLWSPRWVDTDLPGIDRALADPARRVKADMQPVFNSKKFRLIRMLFVSIRGRPPTSSKGGRVRSS